MNEILNLLDQVDNNTYGSPPASKEEMSKLHKFELVDAVLTIAKMQQGTVFNNNNKNNNSKDNISYYFNLPLLDKIEINEFQNHINNGCSVCKDD